MKKDTTNLIVVLMFFLVSPVFAKPSKEPKPMTKAESARVVIITERLEQIDEMDKSLLSYVEKKELRKEVKALDKQRKQLGGGGIYLSVGAVIIIILLLILLV
ncbi:hypothetical protein [Reichenbachiella sp. MALMAid0571]|uniref:hypothetical protein n=1 Tax=Reichenbachiella sp. MALMAid0571 TaxID=3143939 RepID=UPI0032E0442E